MRRLLVGLGLGAIMLALPHFTHAATTKGVRFVQPIVPLECTIEVIDNGSGPTQLITCPQPPISEEEPPTPTEELQPTTGGSVISDANIPRYQQVLLETIGEVPVDSIQRPIETPDNRRFGLQIDQAEPNTAAAADGVSPLIVLTVVVSTLFAVPLAWAIAEDFLVRRRP